MGERNQEPVISEPLDEIIEPTLVEVIDDVFVELLPIASEKRRLAEKRRRAERRLEERRLRDELGYYDLDLDDY